MIPSSVLRLDRAEICEICFSVDIQKKFSGITPEDLDFDFQPLNAKGDNKKKKMLFRIKTNKEDLGVKFRIVVGYDYSFFSSKQIQEEVSVGVTAVFPQILSLIRGILLMVSSCTPRPILLPSIDVIASFDDLIKNQQESGKDENPINIEKQKKRNRK